jgi:hypothetical protein
VKKCIIKLPYREIFPEPDPDDDTKEVYYIEKVIGGPRPDAEPTRKAVAYARSLKVPHMRAAELAHKKYPKVKYKTIYNELRRAKPKG